MNSHESMSEHSQCPRQQIHISSGRADLYRRNVIAKEMDNVRAQLDDPQPPPAAAVQRVRLQCGGLHNNVHRIPKPLSPHLAIAGGGGGRDESIGIQKWHLNAATQVSQILAWMWVCLHLHLRYWGRRDGCSAVAGHAAAPSRPPRPFGCPRALSGRGGHRPLEN